MILEKTADASMTSRGVARSSAPGEAGVLMSLIVNNDDGLCLPKAAAVARGEMSSFLRGNIVPSLKMRLFFEDIMKVRGQKNERERKL